MALDLLWLGVLMSAFYRRHLGHLMAPRAYWPAAFAFYALYGAGILYFCAEPALRSGGLRAAALHGAALGLLVYGVYDLTNMAVLSNWGGLVSAVDVSWGVVLTTLAACAAYKAAA
ncbi:MAG: DUF2177 family protein [Elusimicrobia bacterium]|nr:DUF2177 family protein [Elusimicrobiota bacterium]